MTSQAEKQRISMHILPNVSRNKGNQTMKFGQFLEYNINIFLEKSFIKWDGKTIPRPFSKKSNLNIFVDH